MMRTYFYYAITTFFLFQSCTSKSYLKMSPSLLSKSEDLVAFKFKEEFKELGHNSKPWETSDFLGNGIFWLNANTFLKHDTLVSSRGRKYVSKTEFRNQEYLFHDYGDQELMPLTEDMYFEKVINSARYSPAIIQEIFIKNESEEDTKTKDFYSLKIGSYLVKLFLNPKSELVEKITYLSYDELYGDVTTSFFYSSYLSFEGYTYPSEIRIEKYNGKVIDKVDVLAFGVVKKDFKLLEKPVDYKLAEPKAEGKPVFQVTKYNDYIHFIDLEHTDDRVMVVEMEDYMIVAEAPLNVKNGELIIAEAKKIAPTKPIKYFVFGHHHPHYLGGLRAFVNEGATVLCTDLNKEYVEYIANASHSLEPDKLHNDPNKLKTQIVSDSLVLGKSNAMVIYFIGDKSAHTVDYLMYYFPKDKLLFQDDLCWIPSEGPITKAGARQTGLFNAIKDLNIEVETIIQSWPVTGHKVKTIIPFTDLEESINVD
jgi:glyoxylase-like metal-dependent hydrolase (beta-lactamase superfamily II)